MKPKTVAHKKGNASCFVKLNDRSNIYGSQCAATSNLFKGIQQQCNLISNIQPIMRKKRGSMASQRSSKPDSSYQCQHSELLVNSIASPGPVNIDIGTSTGGTSAMIVEDDIYKDAGPLMHQTIKSTTTADRDGYNLNSVHPHNNTFEQVLTSNIQVIPQEQYLSQRQDPSPIGAAIDRTRTSIKDSTGRSGPTYYIDDTSSYKETSSCLTSQKQIDDAFIPQNIGNVIQYQQQEDSQPDEETEQQKAMNSTSETVCRSNMEAVYDEQQHASQRCGQPNDSRLQTPLQIDTKPQSKPPTGGKVAMSPVLLQNCQPKNLDKYYNMPLARQRSKSRTNRNNYASTCTSHSAQQGIMQTQYSSGQNETSSQNAYKNFDVLSSSSIGKRRETSREKSVKSNSSKPNQTNNSFSFTKSKRGLDTSQEKFTKERDEEKRVQKHIKNYNSRISNMSRNSQSLMNNSYYSNGSVVKQGQQMKKTLSASSLGGRSCYADNANNGAAITTVTRHTNSFMSCIPPLSSSKSVSKAKGRHQRSQKSRLSKQSKENSTMAYEERCSTSVMFEDQNGKFEEVRDSNVGTGDNSALNTVNNSHLTSKLVLVENKNKLNTVNQTNDEIFVDDEDSVCQSRISSLGNTQHKGMTASQKSLKQAEPDYIQSTDFVLGRSQKERISAVKDRIRQQEQQLLQQEQEINDRQIEFEQRSTELSRIFQTQKDDYLTLGQDQMTNEPDMRSAEMTLHPISQQPKANGNLAHSKTNSLQTAHFRNYQDSCQDPQSIDIPQVLKIQPATKTSKIRQKSSVRNSLDSLNDKKESKEASLSQSIRAFDDYIENKQRKSRENLDIQIKHVKEAHSRLNQMKRSKSSSKQYTRPQSTMKHSKQSSVANADLVAPNVGQGQTPVQKFGDKKARVPRSERTKKPVVPCKPQVPVFSRKRKSVTRLNKPANRSVFNTFQTGNRNVAPKQLISPTGNLNFTDYLNLSGTNGSRHAIETAMFNATGATDATIQREFLSSIHHQDSCEKQAAKQFENICENINCSIINESFEDEGDQPREAGAARTFAIEFRNYQQNQDKGCYIDEDDEFENNENYANGKQQEIDEILQDRIGTTEVTQDPPSKHDSRAASSLGARLNNHHQLNTIDQPARTSLTNKTSLKTTDNSNIKPPRMMQQKMLQLYKRSTLLSPTMNRSMSFSSQAGTCQNRIAGRSIQTFDNRRASTQSASASALTMKRSSSAHLRHTASTFDPNKSMSIKHEIVQKNKVSTLKVQFLAQKVQEKRIISQQNEIYRSQAGQLRKACKNIQNECRKLADHIKEGKEAVIKKQQKTKAIVVQKTAGERACTELENDNVEIEQFKQSLKIELETESQLIQDIQFIALRYKKLVADQQREKERLIKQVDGQRKVIQNLQKKRDMYAEDQTKLYENFRNTITSDEQKGVRMKKKTHILRREDRQIFEC